jgi:predicted nucleotidyltransferase
MNQTVTDQIAILKDLILETIPVEQIYLFGSYANGTPTKDSDLDMYVIMKDDASLPEIEAEQKIALAFIGKKTIPADILVSKKSRFERRLTAPTLEREVATKGILLYG